MEAAQIQPHQVWCPECQVGHAPTIEVDGAVKVACEWDSPAQLALMAKDPTIVRPSILRARELEIVGATSRIYTATEHQAFVKAEVKAALADFLTQLKAAGVQVVGATAAPAGGGS